ncbi:MAG: Crp/Fnr family transcriptional regulator [Bacteroidales bacterium]|jgi:CRP-like cAMP-binding protein|nr:Crp/Fnr family transcriptional regulator [Bacteroidales bacterium]MDD3737608.1 Crp/Fnr family transcriptional regulator [Bacteroidales bacterium]NLD62515.1 Crp/Fnr family transcriptional regulator [Bacteroidales bacterium]HNT92508.1 Crp/Fnr family transcriptional regulator [Bacteroidales bacterium]HOO65287.1 Crp/Fnr family transcriptional regulator [Bacteroidales bacterium]
MRFPVLNDSTLFRGLSEAEIENLLEGTGYRVRFFPSGTMIALAGEEIHSLMIVLSGSVRGEMSALAGRTIKIEDINPPQALASAVLFGSGARYPVTVVANIDSELLIINKEDYLTLMIGDRRLLSNYLTFICNKAQFLSGRLRFHSFHTIKGKFAHYISALPGAAMGRVIIDRTQQELAEYFGVTRPSLARAIGEMEHDGLIAVDRREVRLKDMKGLSRLYEV